MKEEDRLGIELDYAWQWFKYHADQRLKAFHFFLVIVGLLANAFTQSIAHESQVGAIGIGIFGVVVAFAFWILDIRNEELVYCGRAALDELENYLRIRIRRDDRARKHLGTAIGDRWLSKRIYPWVRGDPRREYIFSHRRWLRGIESIVGIFFFAATIWAAFWYHR